MEEPEDALEGLLGAPHVALIEVAASHRIKVEFGQGLPDLPRLQDSIALILLSWRALIHRILREEVVQVAEEAYLTRQHPLLPDALLARKCAILVQDLLH
eukprot:CAMPEP_0185576968 /NCGR_PEP_ID=MMETSP0434-20130131/7775_1 /TAXON_ID=626734 ORGANISM="Favella taraikaensis, Strain Fe Narragansett Bay" /NCGR_SAMPLE_ID=MMETSP0434 /ASSEMBLY_ACC=CAM_ASM_000379 /LENGTH=99 /DNA_ID=CAMNT_0028194379 /DNA_START=854 /DNA_END=1153 /DNA_ORIENTATION=-